MSHEDKRLRTDDGPFAAGPYFEPVTIFKPRADGSAALPSGRRHDERT
jgi:hypothetical protein